MREAILGIIFFFAFQHIYPMGDWGRIGHRTVAQIASKQLSKKAMRKISRLLDGESLEVASTWADQIKSDNAYRRYNTWHYVNYPMDSQYHHHTKSEKGDIIQAIDSCVAGLSDDRVPRDKQVFYLKMLVHLIGDLHQPLHIGMAEDRGGNDFQVRWFNKGTNLHRVWDTEMLESYNMSYSELADSRKLLSKAQRAAIGKGDHHDWMRESRMLMKDIYRNTQKGQKLGYDYIYRYQHLLRLQLQKGGIRLAKVLNAIFG